MAGRCTRPLNCEWPCAMNRSIALKMIDLSAHPEVVLLFFHQRRIQSDICSTACSCTCLFMSKYVYCLPVCCLHGCRLLSMDLTVMRARVGMYMY